MNIELIELPADQRGDYYTHAVSIDGVIDSNARTMGRSLHPSDEIIDTISDCPLAELATTFSDISYTMHPDWSEWSFVLRAVLGKDAPYFYEGFDPEPMFLQVLCNINYVNWNRHYSIRQLAEAFETVLDVSGEAIYYFDPLGEGVFGLTIIITDPNSNLDDASAMAEELTGRVQEQALKLVAEKTTPDFITTVFEFPPEVKTACKQYLIYFAQFLADQGIRADTSLRESANKILFTVVPEDKTAALNMIRDALNMFMKAPGDNYFEASLLPTNARNVSIKEWEAEVHLLRSKLALKEAAIALQRERLDFLQYRVSEIASDKRQLTELLTRLHGEKPADTSLVSLKKFETPLVSINLPEIFRRLLRLLRVRQSPPPPSP